MIIFLLFLINAGRDIRRGEIVLPFTAAVIAAGVLRVPVSAALRGSLSFFSEEWEAAALLPGAVLLLVSVCSKGEVGAGDGLTVLAAGFWTGLLPLLWTCLLALALVPAASFLAALRGQPRRRWPFLPFLLAAWITVRILQGGGGI